LKKLEKRGISPAMAEILTSAGLDDQSFLQDELRMAELKGLLTPKGYTWRAQLQQRARVFELMVSNRRRPKRFFFPDRIPKCIPASR